VARGAKFLLVEPKATTPYPPLGLMRISSMLKSEHPKCMVRWQVGCGLPDVAFRPERIYVTSLFTWDLDVVVRTVRFYRDKFPRAEVLVGGVAASLAPDFVAAQTGVSPHVGIFPRAEESPPDYEMTFGRSFTESLTSTTRGCPHHCSFCAVPRLEPAFAHRDGWDRDLRSGSTRIVLWDNNFLASPRLDADADTLRRLRKKVDFNQGLDARLFNKARSDLLRGVDVDPWRFAFDSVKIEPFLVKAISRAKRLSNREVRVYVLYNHLDTPEDLYYRLDRINRMKALAFPMEYRGPEPGRQKLPGPNWDTSLLRAFKLSLLYYYHRGMITESRESFLSIYGHNAQEFAEKLHSIYLYDKQLKRKKKDPE